MIIHFYHNKDGKSLLRGSAWPILLFVHFFCINHQTGLFNVQIYTV